MKRSKNTMKRSARVFLNDLNQGKAEELRAFLYLCQGRTPGRHRSTVRPAADGTSEIAEAMSFFVCFVAIPTMPTSKPRKL